MRGCPTGNHVKHLFVQQEVASYGEEVCDVLQHCGHGHSQGLEGKEAGEDHAHKDQVDGKPEFDYRNIESFHFDESCMSGEP